MSTDLIVEQHLRELEERLLQPEVRKSASDIDVLLADEFVEFGSSGRIFDKGHTIQSLSAESPVLQSLLTFRTMMLAAGVALTTYRVIRHGAAGERPSYSLRSSVWKLIDGRWQMVFHQGTPSEEPECEH